jgi:hypothetical protein
MLLCLLVSWCYPWCLWRRPWVSSSSLFWLDVVPGWLPCQALMRGACAACCYCWLHLPTAPADVVAATITRLVSWHGQTPHIRGRGRERGDFWSDSVTSQLRLPVLVSTSSLPILRSNRYNTGRYQLSTFIMESVHQQHMDQDTLGKSRHYYQTVTIC